MGDTAAFTVTKENVEDDRALLQVNFFLGESCPPNFSFNVKDFNYQICWQFRSLLSCILSLWQHGVIGTGTAVEKQPILDHYIPAHPVDRWIMKSLKNSFAR